MENFDFWADDLSLAFTAISNLEHLGSAEKEKALPLASFMASAKKSRELYLSLIKGLEGSVLRVLEDSLDRVCLGHLNHIRNTPSFRFERSNFSFLRRQWEEGLLTLPQPIREKFNRDDYHEIIQGFRVKKLRTNNFHSLPEKREHLSEEGKRILDKDLIVVNHGSKKHSIDLVFF